MIFDARSPTDVEMLRGGLANKRVIGITSGCFDLCHHLHVNYLKRCRSQCDVLIVGVDSDALVQTRKGPSRPILPEHQRIAVVSELKPVDAAFILHSYADFWSAVDELHASIIFRNDTYKPKPKSMVGREHVRVVIVSDVCHAVSTSTIIEEIKKRG